MADGYLESLAKSYGLDSTDDAREVDLLAIFNGLIDELTKFRKRAGITQTDIAQTMGTNQATIAKLESHRHDPRLSTLARYVAALGLGGYELARMLEGLDSLVGPRAPSEPVERLDESALVRMNESPVSSTPHHYLVSRPKFAPRPTPAKLKPVSDVLESMGISPTDKRASMLKVGDKVTVSIRVGDEIVVAEDRVISPGDTGFSSR